MANLGLDARTTGKNDITVDGKKVSSVAQRIHKNRILHHGCLLFSSDKQTIASVLRPSDSKFLSKSSKSVRSRVTNISAHLDKDLDIHEFWNILLSHFSKEGLVQEKLSDWELKKISELAEQKHASWDWTWGRALEFTYKNKRRFSSGELCIELLSRHGLVDDIRFYGDFMATTDCTAAVSALQGLRLERKQLSQAFESLDIKAMFGSITPAEILDVIFN